MSELYKKIDYSLLLPFAKQLTRLVIPFIPTWTKPNHITIFGLLIGMNTAIAYYLASFNKLWLIVIPLLIFLFWFADNLDGELARARSQTSDQGFFLDLFLDSLTFTMTYLAIGFASYSAFKLWSIISIITLLRIILILFSILLRKQFILPVIGTAEVSVVFILVTILQFVWYDSSFQISNYSMSCFDAFAIVFIPLAGLDMIATAWKLFKQLDGKNEVSPVPWEW